MAPAIAVSPFLTKILVDDNELGDAGATILCDALRESTVTKVEELNLSDNGIGPEGAKAVAAMAAVVASITDLNLFNNIIKDEGVTVICEALQSNKDTKLASLNISGNAIGPAGAKAVAAMAAVVASLTSVR